MLTVMASLAVAGGSHAQTWRGFPSPANYSIGSLQAVATGDFNGDGITDLVTANDTLGSVSVLLGNEDSLNPGTGDGTFANRVSYSAGGNLSPASVTTGDFNGDGITDLATAGEDNSQGVVSVLLGDEDGSNPGFGDGTFGAPALYNVGNSPTSVTTGDFNGDGITDLATANFNSNDVSVLLGDEDGSNPGFGDGTFAAEVDYNTGGAPESVTTGDFNGDGITDLATANGGGNNVSVLLGDEDGSNPGFGDGTFAAAVNYPAGDPRSVTTGDFNGDGITDLATANVGTNNVSVLLGDGTFAVAVNYAAGSFPSSVTTGDFNGDGITDLATANPGSNNVSVLLGNGSVGVGDGTFASPINYAVGNFPSSVTTGDFNGDGFTDLVTANRVSGNLSVLLNLGITEPDPVLAPDALDFGNVELGSAPVALSVVIDVTGDEDLISTPTLTNDGGGAFSLTSVPVSPLPQGTSDSLEVTFAPITLGPVTGEVTLATNDLTSPTVTIALSGTGVDTQEPTSTVTGPTGSLTQPSPTFDVTYTAADNAGGSGLATVELFYQRNGGGYTQYLGGPFTSSPIIFDTGLTGGDGSYDFYTVASDIAGNTETKAPAAEASVVFNDTTDVADWTLLDE